MKTTKERALKKELIVKANMSAAQAEKALSVFESFNQGENIVLNDPASQYVAAAKDNSMGERPANRFLDYLSAPITSAEDVYNLLPQDEFSLIEMTRAGISYAYFDALMSNNPFTLKEWSIFLHITERTLQRYKKDQKPFEGIHAQRIVEIAQLIQKGISVFGKLEYVHTWLDSEVVALGGIKPKEHLDNTFGIEILHNELTRIEHGVLA